MKSSHPRMQQRAKSFTFRNTSHVEKQEEGISLKGLKAGSRNKWLTLISLVSL